MKNLIILIVIAAVSFVFMSCDKDKPKEETTKAKTIDITKLPVYYNGIEMNCLMENFSKPASKGGDMEEVSIVEESAVYIFDEDTAFYNYCVDNENIEMYETTKKLDVIYAKAVELGITELGETDPIPTAMLNYYNQIFDVTSIPSQERGILGKLYTQQYCQQQLCTFFPIFQWSFWTNNNKARSYAISGTIGCNWMCTKTWFGGDRLILVFYNSNGTGVQVPTLPAKFDKKLCSSFGLF